MTKKMHFATALLAGAALGGCATSPVLDSTFGQSVRGALAAQVIDPTASANTNAVQGIDARAALGAQQQYEKSFSAPPAYRPAMVAGSSK